jgi:hypothetical protein
VQLESYFQDLTLLGEHFPSVTIFFGLTQKNLKISGGKKQDSHVWGEDVNCWRKLLEKGLAD